MSEHTSLIEWSRAGAVFTDNRYSRRHRWTFDGGAVVVASSAPTSVPVPMSAPEGVDPEEAFVASLSSCHMLWFLAIAAKRGFVIDAYTDHAAGVLATNAAGKSAMTVVTLRPALTFRPGPTPSRADIEAMHHEAHERCFIANSVLTEVRCEPVHSPESRP